MEWLRWVCLGASLVLVVILVGICGRTVFGVADAKCDWCLGQACASSAACLSGCHCIGGRCS
jgi:hypothetical protein